MNIVKKNWPLVILIVSLFAITAALVAEYIFNILPCQMCLYQRYPYYFIIFFTLIFILIKKIPLIFYYWINACALAIGLFYATWHVGIENKILPGLSGCKNVINKSLSTNELKKQIIEQNIITCDEVTWSFLGFSAATYNAILLILLFLINLKFITDKHRIGK